MCVTDAAGRLQCNFGIVYKEFLLLKGVHYDETNSTTVILDSVGALIALAGSLG